MPFWHPLIFCCLFIFHLGFIFFADVEAGLVIRSPNNRGGTELAAYFVHRFIKAAFLFLIFRGEEGKLGAVFGGYLGEGNAQKPKGHFFIPKFGKKPLADAVNFGSYVRRFIKSVLVGMIFEVVAADGHADAESLFAVGTHSCGNAVRKGKQDFMGGFGGDDVFLEGGGNAEALGFLGLFKDRGRVDAVGIVVYLLANFFAYKGLYGLQIEPCKVADGFYPGSFKFIGGGMADAEKFPNRERPHFRRNFICKKGVNPVWFFKIAGHLGKNFAWADAHIDGEAQLAVNSVLYFISRGDGVGIKAAHARHIKETFVYGIFFDHWGVFPADIHKGFRAFDVKAKIRLGKVKIRAFAQGHGDGFAGFDAEFLRWDGFCKDDAGALIPIAADGCGDEANIVFAVSDSSGGFPGKEGAVHVDMKNNAFQPEGPLSPDDNHIIQRERMFGKRGDKLKAENGKWRRPCVVARFLPFYGRAGACYRRFVILP